MESLLLVMRVLHMRPINSWSSYKTEEDAIKAFRDNCRLGRFAEVYKWNDDTDDYKRIINTGGERK